MKQVFLQEEEIRLLCINSGILCLVMMTLRFGIITCPTVQSIQMTTLLLLVQIDTSGMFLHQQRHLAIENAKQHCCVLLCCTLEMLYAKYIHLLPAYGEDIKWLRLRSVYHNPTCSLPLLFPLLSYRKHALNCHRMKPALFSVLCEIKEKTGEFLLLLHSFFLFSSLHKLKCTQPLLQFTWHQVTFLFVSQNSFHWSLIVFVVELI